MSRWVLDKILGRRDAIEIEVRDETSLRGAQTQALIGITEKLREFAPLFEEAKKVPSVVRSEHLRQPPSRDA